MVPVYFQTLPIMTEQTSHIAVDTSPEDNLDTHSSASERTSLRSSIAGYVYENGRRYHAYHAGEYWGSNDERSMDAMDILYVVTWDDSSCLFVSTDSLYF
jgi:hypothetical protein